jgi:hypothetical protein
LIDTYVRGGLLESDRRAFERQFLNSTNRRRKVEFARALAVVAAGSLVPRQTRPSPRELFRGIRGIGAVRCFLSSSPWPVAFRNANGTIGAASFDNDRAYPYSTRAAR